MKGSVLIRTDADNSTGYGHLMRCLSLATELRRHRQRAMFVMRRVDAPARAIVKTHGFQLHRVATTDSLAQEARELHDLGFDRFQPLVLDFSHRHVLARATEIPAYLEALRGSFRPIIMLDGLREDSIAGRVARLDADILVMPYVGADRGWPIPAGVKTSLTGPKYFVFSPDFQALAGKKRRVRSAADRILITFGGTDLHRITLKALEAIRSLSDRKLCVRVIIGPGFDRALVGEIMGTSIVGLRALDAVNAPASLARHMAWCDLAITGSGLTKYELAVTGTPSIQLSIDEMHARVNEDFVQLGSAIHLGVHNCVSTHRLAAEIRQVLDNPDRRREMSRCGYALSDGRGSKRIVGELMRMVYAS